MLVTNDIIVYITIVAMKFMTMILLHLHNNKADGEGNMFIIIIWLQYLATNDVFTNNNVRASSY